MTKPSQQQDFRKGDEVIIAPHGQFKEETPGKVWENPDWINCVHVQWQEDYEPGHPEYGKTTKSDYIHPLWLTKKEHH